MKKMKLLQKTCLWLMVFALGVGFFLPTGVAHAESVTAGEITSFEDVTFDEFEWEEIEEGYDEAYDEDYGLIEEGESYSDYEVAMQILDNRLSESGQQLNADQTLYDFYGKFSEKEQEEISSWIEEKEAESGISIRVIVTEMDMYYEKYFLEECTDRLCDNGYASEDMAIMLLNLDTYNRGVCIQGHGLCETRVNDDRIEYMLDDMIEYFGKDDYVYGIKLFATEAAYYAGSTDYYSYYEDNSFLGKVKRMPWMFILGAPVVVAAVGILLMLASTGGAKSANARTYIQNSSSGLTAQKDDYVRTSVTRTYSPQSSGSSGGSRSGGRSSGGGGRSRGGRSHSGGSRRF